MTELTAEQIARFQEDGFLILERFIDPAEAAKVAARYEDMFRGRFETGSIPTNGTGRRGATRRTGPGRSATAGNPTAPWRVWY